MNEHRELQELRAEQSGVRKYTQSPEHRAKVAAAAERRKQYRLQVKAELDALQFKLSTATTEELIEQLCNSTAGFVCCMVWMEPKERLLVRVSGGDVGARAALDLFVKALQRGVDRPGDGPIQSPERITYGPLLEYKKHLDWYPFSLALIELQERADLVVALAMGPDFKALAVSNVPDVSKPGILAAVVREAKRVLDWSGENLRG